MQSSRAWLLGVGGLFGFHFFYFTALRGAPPVEASLIVYLWPLLIVVFSALLPGERLQMVPPRRRRCSGWPARLWSSSGGRAAVDRSGFLAGYAAAFASALTWSGYSVLSRRLAGVPTGAVAGFCLATAALSAVAHLAPRGDGVAVGVRQWLAVAGLGLMPVGAAFYVWDYGVKHGDIQVLGASAYAAPLISTAVLIVAGYARADLVDRRRRRADRRRCRTWPRRTCSGAG